MARGQKINWYSNIEWLNIFENSVETLGGIPPIQNWKKELGIPFHVSTISHYLAKKYPHMTNRLKYFVEDLKPGLSLFLKRNRANNTETEHQNIKNFKKFCLKLGRTPTYSEYAQMQRVCKKEGLPRIERLLVALKCNKYAEVLQKLELPPAPNYTNAFYTQKLIEFGLQIEPEVFFKIEGKSYRIDYKISLDSGDIVYLEIDGSSHISANSKYHLNSTFWKKEVKSAVESFNSKKERDLRINKFFNENKIPLLRIRHHHFLNITKNNLDSMIQDALFNKVKNYSSMMGEKANKIKNFLLQGLSVADIGRVMEHAAPYIFKIIKKYNLSQYQRIKILDIEKQAEIKMFKVGVLYEKGYSITDIQKNIKISSGRIKICLRRLGLIPVVFPENFDYLVKTVKKRDSIYSRIRELKKLKDTGYITVLRTKYVKYKDILNAK